MSMKKARNIWMNNFVQTVIDWFKKRFELQVEKKTEIEVVSDFSDIREISVTSALSERLSTLTLADSSLAIVGENQRAKYIDEFAQKFMANTLPAIAQITLGTGDCIAKPNTDGKRFGIDLIENKNFRIVQSVGDFIYAILIKCDEKHVNNDTYERWEYHKLNEYEGATYVTITQVCFKNGKKIGIEEVPEWAMLKENQVIPNVDRLLLGRFKCPKLNRQDVNSPNGVPITFGADEIVKEAKESWRRFNQEYKDKETMVFADRTVFKTREVKGRDAEGNLVTKKVSVLPQGKERVIMDINASRNVDAQPLIHEYSPAIRDTALEAEIERNFRMLELFCGLSEGILSKSTLTYTNSDEVKKSTQATFSLITALRKVLEKGTEDLLYAINVLCNANEVTPMGEWHIDFDWSDSFVESMTERFNQLLQAESIGAVSTAEFRAWVMNEDLEVAQAELEEIEKQQVVREEMLIGGQPNKDVVE